MKKRVWRRRVSCQTYNGCLSMLEVQPALAAMSKEGESIVMRCSGREVPVILLMMDVSG